MRNVGTRSSFTRSMDNADLNVLNSSAISKTPSFHQSAKALLSRARSSATSWGAELAYRYRGELGAIALFLVITLIVTYPLVLRFSSHVPVCCDTWLYYWYMWWTKESLFAPDLSPFYSNFMYYPIGARLSFEGLYNSMVGAVLWPLFGGVVSFNLLFLSTYVIGAFGVYLLVLQITGDRKASIVAGVIFVFAPIRNQYLQFSNISTIQWIPFFALWSMKLMDKPTLGRACVTGVLFFLVVLSSGYFAVSAALMLAVILLWNFRKTLNWEFARTFGVFIIAFLIWVFPFVWIAVGDALSAEFSYYALGNKEFVPLFSADVYSFVVPSDENPLYAKYVRHIYQLFMTHSTERASYLGIITICLMLLGALKVELGKTGLWIVIFFLFVILSLGSHLQIMGKQFDDFRLPFYYLQELPVMESIRSPKRFLVTAMLAASVVAGLGANYIFITTQRLTQKISSSEGIGKGLGLALMAVLIGLIMTDYWGWPRTLVTSNASYSSFLEELAQEPDDGVTLSIPIAGLLNTQSLYYQTIHEKKLVGGYVERPLREAFDRLEQNKFIKSITLASLQPEEKREITREEEEDALRLFSEIPELKYVLYMKKLFLFPDQRIFAVYRPWLEDRFGSPVFEDELIAVYRVFPQVLE